MAQARVKVLLAVVALAAVAGVVAIAWHPRAPDITLRTIEGDDVALATLRGKVVLVNFWATTCKVCVEEMPQIVSLHRDLQPRGFEVVAVAMSYDPPWIVADYASRKQLPFIVAPDIRGDIERAFGGIDGTPTSFLIDERGRVVQTIAGRPDFEALRARIARLLRRGSAQSCRCGDSCGTRKT